MRGQRYTTEQQRIDAFEAKYTPEPNSGCWLWNASFCRDGYGNFYDGKRVIGAHRYAWTVYCGAIPDGLHILHKCDTPACVNPAHLSLGTHRENMHDSLVKGRNFFATKTHCKHGHAFTPDNITNVKLEHKRRRCKACERTRALRAYYKNKGVS